MNDTLEVWWNGSHKDTYLCVPDYRPAAVFVAPVLEERALFEDDPDRKHQDRSRERELILRTLAARETWRIAELRALCRVSPAVISGVLNRLVAQGHVERAGFGVVALKSSFVPQRKAEP